MNHQAMNFTMNFQQQPQQPQQQQQQEEQVRVVSYNVLNPCLVRNPEGDEPALPHLESQYRLEKLREKLAYQMKSGAIIALQEVSTKWIGQLHALFASHNYHFVWTGYGNRFQGSMGVAIAVPLSLYGITDVDIKTIADVKYAPRKSLSGKSWLAVIYDFVVAVLRWLRLLSQQQRTVWQTARGRMNQAISVQLRSNASGREFVVSTYHMPCLFAEPQVMVIHATLLCNHVKRYAKALPYILVGDFNSTPDSSVYQLITKGKLNPDNPDIPPKEFDGDGFRPSVQPMLSAYRAVLKKGEPDFTNFVVSRHGSKEQPFFQETIDYIFLSRGWYVTKVHQLPRKGTKGSMLPQPNPLEPSDHLLLAATLRYPQVVVGTDPNNGVPMQLPGLPASEETKEGYGGDDPIEVDVDAEYQPLASCDDDCPGEELASTVDSRV
jgi:mRNA deadenylase 3'-5' endonuclease subunit Ccr4